jgi:flagellar biosynthetic protein FlhB
MAEDKEDQGSKTEDPTEKKLLDARKKGDVPISKEVGHFLLYGAILLFSVLLLPSESKKLSSALGEIFLAAPQMEISSESNGIMDLVLGTTGLGQAIFSFVGKALILMLSAAMLSGVLQGPLVFSLERMKPKGSKISPLKGAKKIVGADNLVEFFKNTVKLITIGTVSLWIVYIIVTKILPGTAVAPESLPKIVLDHAIKILTWVCALMVPVVIADYIWKRLSYTRKQRMSIKDIKDEHKQSEGDPQIKARRDQIRREQSRRRIAVDVPTATLILTNPTHYSVALKYERGHDLAPICIAKGTDLLAARIREIAHENNIPVIESRALARALYATVEVDQVIPEAHWPIVAELIGFVIDMRNKIHRKLPEDSSLRFD